jgi:hypothetical protein
MGATISPAYHGILRKVDPTAYKCDCGIISFISWNEYLYDSVTCKCGSDIYNVDFYPTEFDKVETHLAYSSIKEMLDILGLDFDYCGEISTAVLASRIDRLKGTRYYDLMTDMVKVAQMLNVDISYG